MIDEKRLKELDGWIKTVIRTDETDELLRLARLGLQSQARIEALEKCLEDTVRFQKEANGTLQAQVTQYKHKLRESEAANALTRIALTEIRRELYLAMDHKDPDAALRSTEEIAKEALSSNAGKDFLEAAEKAQMMIGHALHLGYLGEGSTKGMAEEALALLDSVLGKGAGR